VLEPRACTVRRLKSKGQTLRNRRQAQKADKEVRRADGMGKGKEGLLESEVEEHDSSDDGYDNDDGHQHAIHPDPFSFLLILVGLASPCGQPVLRNHKDSLAQHEAC